MSCFDFCCSDEKLKQEKEEFSKLKQEFVDDTENTFNKAYALVEECYKKYDTLLSENNELKMKNITLERKIRELKSMLDKQKQEITKMQDLYEQTKDFNDEIKKLNKDYAELIEKYKVDRQRLITENTNLKKKIPEYMNAKKNKPSTNLPTTLNLKQEEEKAEEKKTQNKQ